MTREQRSFAISLLSSLALHGTLLAIGVATFTPIPTGSQQMPTLMLFAEGNPDSSDEEEPRHMAALPDPEFNEPIPNPPTAPLTAPEIPETIETALTPNEPREAAPFMPAAAPVEESSTIIGIAVDTMAMKPPPSLLHAPSIPVEQQPEPRQAAPPPTPSVVTQPRVAPGGAGRRGVRNGLDSRGLPLPEYPSESRRRREEGIVELDVEILPDGSVGEVRVTRDPGLPLLVRAAIEAVKLAKFDPATRDGQPISGHLIIPFRFTLE